ncbi:MAG TPA: CPBP family intramembrane glutamic endopeptidase [Woeseiaceae bacterium]|nr:CPBP family intramembrane glutamic endopeptidase [Woeseiaceae bacterium]
MPRTIPARPAFAVSVAAVVLFQVAALVARSSLELLLLRRGYAAPHAADLSFLVVPPVLLLFMSPWARRCAAPLCGLLRLRDLTWRTVALGVALGLDLRLLRWAALGWSLPAAGGDGASIGPLVGFACPPAGELLLATLVTVGLVPVVEETIHRGVILHALLARGRTLAIAVSTLVFALLHAPSAWALTLLGGALFGWQTLALRTLWPALFAHATYNAAALLDSRCTRLVWHPAGDDPLAALAALASAAVLPLGLAFAGWIVTRKRRGNPGKPPAGSRPAGGRRGPA